MIRLALVDDHAPMRQSLREYLQQCAPDLSVIAEGRNGAQACDIAVQTAPDVLLMDLAMPGQNGLDALVTLRARAPRVGVLILSGYPEEFYALDALQRGAAGFVHKNCEPEQIVQAIRAVASGRLFVTPQLARLLLAGDGQAEADLSPETLASVEAALAARLQVCAWPPPIFKQAAGAAA